jgi:hypothetical protein
MVVFEPTPYQFQSTILGWYSFELRTIRFLRSSKGPSGMVRCIGSLLFLREGDGGDRIGRLALDNLGLFWNTLNVRGKLPPR